MGEMEADEAQVPDRLMTKNAAIEALMFFQQLFRDGDGSMAQSLFISLPDDYAVFHVQLKLVSGLMSFYQGLC